MERDIEKDLLDWKNRKDRLSLILRGARQVGKTFSVEKFGKNHFQHLCIINFELEPFFETAFENLDPFEIIHQIESKKGIPIIPGKTLLFLDEIQYCPKAILALRYFKEKMGGLHVISAGSLLEFTLHEKEFSFPVGRVEFLYMYPLSFKEFLFNQSAKKRLLEEINKASIANPLPELLHQALLDEVKKYMILGGMPKVVENYLVDHSFRETERLQNTLLQTYRNDFGKYATKTEYRYLQKFFEKAPYIVGDHFKYVNIDPDARSRELKVALTQLSWAGLIHQVFSTSAAGLPLEATLKENKFKLLFLDIGLLQSANPVAYESILQSDVRQINRGTIAEQFVGQEILAYTPAWDRRKLFFWEREVRNAEAEVDYVMSLNNQIVPVEVKAGKIGHLKSLHIFMREKKIPLGIRISELPLSLEGNVLNVPFYLISQLSRLMKEAKAVH